MFGKPVDLAALLGLSVVLLAPQVGTAQVFTTTEVDGPNGQVFYTYPAGSAAPGVPAFDPWAYGYPFSALASALNFYSGAPHPADLPSSYYYVGLPEQMTIPGAGALSFASMGTPVPSAPAAAAPPPASTVGMIDVRVPSDAKVWVQGKPSIQTGALRHFVSGNLEAGSAYTYRVRATWNENGRKVSREQLVVVHPGDREAVTFVDPQAQAARQTSASR